MAAKPFIIKFVSARAIAAKAQQQPQEPWSLTDVIIPRYLQSIERGADNFIGPPLLSIGRAEDTGASGIWRVNISTS